MLLTCNPTDPNTSERGSVATNAQEPLTSPPAEASGPDQGVDQVRRAKTRQHDRPHNPHRRRRRRGLEPNPEAPSKIAGTAAPVTRRRRPPAGCCRGRGRRRSATHGAWVEPPPPRPRAIGDAACVRQHLRTRRQRHQRAGATNLTTDRSRRTRPRRGPGSACQAAET
jgi:hypothetical protein